MKGWYILNLEHEIKGLISKESFETIINQLPVNAIIKQSNYYFETSNDFYKARKAALRIREKNDTYELTLKRKVGASNEEYNLPISKSELDAVFSTHCLNYDNHPIKPDEPLCKSLIIKTERYCIPYLDHMIELDKTDFNGTIDYEIELEAETIEKAKEVFDSFINEFSIAIKPSTAKIARYLQYNNQTWRNF